MNELFKEKVPTLPLLSVLLGFSALLILIVVAAPYFGKAIEMSVFLQVFLLATLVLVVITWLAFRELTITVTPEFLTFGYGRFRKKVALMLIEKVEVTEYKFSNYYGYGIRFGRDGSIGYTPKGGTGLKIWIKDEKRPYFFTTERAQELKTILEKERL